MEIPTHSFQGKTRRSEIGRRDCFHDLSVTNSEILNMEFGSGASCSQRLEQFRALSVGFCRLHLSATVETSCNISLTLTFSIQWMNLLISPRTGTPNALFHATYKNIGFPGWPEPNLDWVRFWGGRLTKGGLHQPPFYFSTFVSRTNLSIR